MNCYWYIAIRGTISFWVIPNRIVWNRTVWSFSCVHQQKCVHKSYTLYRRGALNRFPDFFVHAFKIVVDSWEFTMLLLYILWDDRPIFRISASNKQLQQQLEYTLLKPDCHCWWVSKMQSGCQDTLEERYAIKLCFKLEKKKCHRNV